MTLVKEDIDFIKQHLGEWLVEHSLGKPLVVYEIELRERLVRAEEELKYQRELMKQGFDLIERRFEQIDKRFEQVDKRFEQMDARFEALTRRIDRFMFWSFGITLTAAGIVIAAPRLWPPGQP